ncbi:3-oxoacyl-ACP reductase FabG [soil metagenome]|nr:SDR family oxidoreductase [Trueperaceae bacterium]
MIARFDASTVIVTGAAHGFGRAIALAFVERGATVWACDVIADSLAETTRLGAGRDGALHTRLVDITDREAVMAFASEAESASASGAVDVLVNNAGGVGGQVGRPMEEITTEAWRALFAINVDAAFTFSQAVVPGMKRIGSGRIVSISSGAGLGVSLTGIQAYASAKAAQIGLTRQLAHELGRYGITVNNVAPGFVRSNPTTERQWMSYGEAGQAALLERIALRRLGTPDDIANAVVFFASPFAGWVTGQVLSVDGGK